LRLAFARRLAANASLALLLSMAFAGVVNNPQIADAAPTAADVCPSGFSLVTINNELYCQRSATGASSFTFTAPSGTNQVYVDIRGAQGGWGGQNGATPGAGGAGERVFGFISVSPGANLGLYSANAGGNGSCGCSGGQWGWGGGGGGSTFAGFEGGGGGSSQPYNQYTYGSGGGGGGGAAVFTINSTPSAVAAGGAGGGGSDGGGVVQAVTQGNLRPVGTTAGQAGGSGINSGAGGGGGGGIRGGLGGVAGGGDGNGTGGSQGLSLVPDSMQATISAPAGAGSVLVRFLAMPKILSVTKSLPAGTVSNQVSYSYIVSFSEDVTGFGAEDITLGGTAGAASGWSLQIDSLDGGTTYLVTAVNPNAPSGTFTMSVNGTGVVSGDRVGTSSTTSAIVTIDRTPPSVVSSVFNPGTMSGRLEVVMTFSETISSTLNWSAFTFSGTATGWSTLSAVVSGNTLRIVISGSNIVDDTTLNYSLWAGFVRDLNGNALVAAHMDSLAIDLDPVVVTISRPVLTFSSSVTVAVNFAAPVTGLAVGDFSFASNTTGCSITGLTGSGSSYQLTVGTCTAGGSGQLQIALTGSAAVSLLGAPSPAARIFSPTISYDARVPVAGLVSKTISGTVASYVISFSEPIVGLNASRISISHSVPGGASGWSISSFLDLGNNFYSFTVNNSAAPNGTVSFSFIAGVTDTTGNPLSLSLIHI
jgi:hypothetical protein